MLKDPSPQGGWEGDKAPYGLPEVSGCRAGPWLVGSESQGRRGFALGKFKGGGFGLLRWVLRPQQGQGSERLPRGTLAAFCSRTALPSRPASSWRPGAAWAVGSHRP